MTENYLVLDNIYYWHIQDTVSHDNALFQIQKYKEEGREAIILTMLTTGVFARKYAIYVRDENDLGPKTV